MVRTLWLLVLAWTVSTSVGAAIVAYDLGTAAPPATLGGLPMTAFETAPQNAIADLSNITNIPGGPGGTSLFVSAGMTKVSVPSGGWVTWSHGYTGAVYDSDGALNRIVALPAGATAFYLYVEGGAFTTSNVTVESNNGTRLTVAVDGNGGASGYGFAATGPGETISAVTVSADPSSTGFAIGEFGISMVAPGAVATASPIPTLSEWSLLLLSGLVLALALRRLGRKAPRSTHLLG